MLLHRANHLPTKRKIFIITVILLGFGIVTNYVLFQNLRSYQAQTPTLASSLELSPPTQNIEGDPGQTIQFEVIVRNKGTETESLITRIEDFTASGDRGQVALIDKGPWSTSSWTVASPSAFTLAPREEQKITLTMSIPEQNVGGGKYGALVVSRGSEGAPNAAGIAQEAASLFLLKVSGPVTEKLRITSLSIPSFLEAGPVPIQIKAENEGNVHVKAMGVISITNILGKKVEDIVIPPTNIFPLSTRTIEVTLDKRFLIGPYQALAIMHYGSENQSITEFAPFLVFPIKIVAFVLITSLLLLLLRKKLSRHMRKKARS